MSKHSNARDDFRIRETNGTDLKVWELVQDPRILVREHMTPAGYMSYRAIIPISVTGGPEYGLQRRSLDQAQYVARMKAKEFIENQVVARVLGACGFLHKPVNREKLARAVHTILDGQTTWT